MQVAKDWDHFYILLNVTSNIFHVYCFAVMLLETIIVTFFYNLVLVYVFWSKQEHNKGDKSVKQRKNICAKGTHRILGSSPIFGNLFLLRKKNCQTNILHIDALSHHIVPMAAQSP